MKKIYKELIFIPEDGKIREKVFFVRMGVLVSSILLSLVAMSFTAYAYFTHTITANFGVIKSANWEITVTVTTPEGVTPQAGGGYVIENTDSQAKVYEFKVVKDTQTATASVGYVRVDMKTDVDNFTATQTFYSQCIGEILVDGEMINVLERVIKVTVPANKKVIMQFVGEWGTYAGTPIIDESVGIHPAFANVTEEVNKNQQSTQQLSEIKSSESKAEEVQQNIEQPQEPVQDVANENNNEESELQDDVEQTE